MTKVLLAALLLAAQPAAAFGPAALPPSLVGVRLAAGDVPALPGGAPQAAQSSWRDLIRFSDQPNPLLTGRRYKAWLPQEKQLILDYVGWVVRNQPGLWRRVAAYGPLTLYRADNVAQKLATTADTTITFTDRAVVGSPGPVLKYSLGLHIVIHELSHVADMNHSISSSQGWRALVERPMRDYHAQAPALATGKERLALAERLGLVSNYGAEDPHEALAELTMIVAVKPLMSAGYLASMGVSQPLADFIDREMLSNPPAGPSLGAELRGATYHVIAGRRAEAYAAYTRAIQLDPTSPVAYIRRARVALMDPSLPKTAEADVAAARPLLADFSKEAVYFYQAATTAGAVSGRYAEVLQDCAAASARELEDGTILFNCGRVRMMDTMGRTMRRQMSPEQTARGYAEAAEELRRAKALSPSLAPKIEPLERQLESLSRPKAPAA